MSYHNWASVCRATNALCSITLIHAEQYTSIQWLSQLHNIYQPAAARTHPQCIQPELNKSKKWMKVREREKAIINKWQNQIEIANFSSDRFDKLQNKKQQNIDKVNIYYIKLTFVRCYWGFVNLSSTLFSDRYHFATILFLEFYCLKREKTNFCKWLKFLWLSWCYVMPVSMQLCSCLQ